MLLASIGILARGIIAAHAVAHEFGVTSKFR